MPARRAALPTLVALAALARPTATGAWRRLNGYLSYSSNRFVIVQCSHEGGKKDIAFVWREAAP
jgi:hypothetical protein